MDATTIAAVFDLIVKGMTVLEAVIAEGKQAAPAIATIVSSIKALITGAKQGSVTDEQLAQTEAVLDQMIADFNLDLPAVT